MCNYFEQNKQSLRTLIQRYSETSGLAYVEVSIGRWYSGNAVGVFIIDGIKVEIRQHRRARYFTIAVCEEGQEPKVLCESPSSNKSYLIAHKLIGIVAAMLLIKEGRFLKLLSNTEGRVQGKDSIHD